MLISQNICQKRKQEDIGALLEATRIDKFGKYTLGNGKKKSFE